MIGRLEWYMLILWSQRNIGGKNVSEKHYWACARGVLGPGTVVNQKLRLLVSRPWHSFWLGDSMERVIILEWIRCYGENRAKLLQLQRSKHHEPTYERVDEPVFQVKALWALLSYSLSAEWGSSLDLPLPSPCSFLCPAEPLTKQVKIQRSNNIQIWRSVICLESQNKRRGGGLLGRPRDSGK